MIAKIAGIAKIDHLNVHGRTVKFSNNNARSLRPTLRADDFAGSLNGRRMTGKAENRRVLGTPDWGNFERRLRRWSVRQKMPSTV